MRKLLLTGAAALLLAGCGKSVKEYQLTINQKEAHAVVYFSEGAVSNYHVAFTGKTPRIAWMESLYHRDAGNNGVPDVDLIGVRCNFKDPWGIERDEVIYVNLGDGWVPDYSVHAVEKPACPFPENALLMAKAAENAVKEAVEKAP